MEEVKGRKKRERKLGIRLAIIMARMERVRVWGESFRLARGFGNWLNWWGLRKLCYSYLYLLSRRMNSMTSAFDLMTDHWWRNQTSTNTSLDRRLLPK